MVSTAFRAWVGLGQAGSGHSMRPKPGGVPGAGEQGRRLGWGRVPALVVWVAAWVGWLVVGPGAVGADYLQSGLSTWMSEPVELVLENSRVLSEIPWRDGRVLLEVRADVRNAGDSTWEKVEVNVKDLVAGVAPNDLPLVIEHPGEVRPGGTGTPTNTLFAVVSAGSLASARGEIEAGVPFFFTGLKGGFSVVGRETNLVAHFPTVTSETSLGGGEYLLEIATGIRNVGLAGYSNITVRLDSSLGTVAYRPAQGSSSTGTERLAPFGTVTTLGSMLVTVSTNEVTAVRAELGSGAGLTRAGAEMWVYAFPPKAIDQETEDAFEFPAVWANMAEREIRLTFTNATPFLLSLVPGDLLVQNADVNLLDPSPEYEEDPLDRTYNFLPAFVPFEVKSVTVTSNEVEVVGVERLLVEAVRSATLVASALDLFRNPVRDPYKPDPEVTLIATEEAERNVEAGDLEWVDPTHGRLADLKGMVSIPWHFNTHFISDKVSISGEVLLRQSGVKVETKIEDFRVERVTVGMDAGVVVNLVIECNEKEDTADDPPDKKQKTLFKIDQIPVFTFSLGGMPVTVKPVFEMTAGVEANIPTRLTLPLQSSFTMGMEMGYDRAQEQMTGDGFFYRPILDFVPVRVSDPTVFDELAATLSLWAQLDMKLLIEAGSGITLDSGPSIGMRLQNDYRLAPFDNPWWEVDLGLDVIGAFDVNLDFAGLENLQLVDTSASLHHWDLFHQDSGGPLIQGVGGSSAALAGAPSGNRVARDSRSTAGSNGATGSKPRIGEHVRWARQFYPRPNFTGLEDGFVLPVPGSDGHVIAGGYGPASFMARFDRTGEVVWMRDTFPWQTIHVAAGGPGGTYFTAGLAERNTLVGALYDAEGERVWSTALLSTPLFAVESAAVRTNAAGQAEYFVGGHVHHGTIRTSDPALIKFGPDGAVVWARYYANPGDDEIRGMTVTSDGHVVVAGYVRESVPPPPYGVPIADLANVSVGGLLMKVDGETGDVRWGTVCPAKWSMTFHEVIEGPGGVLFAAGEAPRTVSLTRPSNLIARFSPDGALEAHVTVGNDPEWPSALVGGGRSPYDKVLGLKWTQEGLVACGESGLGVSISAWAMGLTESLGVRFFSAFDASGSSRFFDVADSGDGLVAIGNAWCPFPVGSKTNQYLPWLVKLPREGILRFSEESGYESLFLQPWTHHSSANHEFQIVSSIQYSRSQKGASPAEVFFGNTHGPAELEATPLPWEPRASPGAPTVATNVTLLALEFGAPPGGVVGTGGGGVGNNDWPGFDAWAATQGLPPGSLPTVDTDGDGWVDALEAYFGRNAKVPETSPMFTWATSPPGTASSLALAFVRSVFARAWEMSLESSEDLKVWVVAGGVVESVSALDATTEAVTLTVPISAGVPHRFYRLRVGGGAAAALAGDRPR